MLSSSFEYYGPVAAILWFFFYPSALIGEEAIRFDRISLREGSFQDAVFEIIQDKTGYMWFATRYGLYKYDGYEFTAYKHDPENLDSISNSTVTNLCLDRKGFIWVSTEVGSIDLLDPNSGRFKHYSNASPDLPGSGNDLVEDMYVDRDGVLWVTTLAGRLLKHESSLDRFVQFDGAPQKDFDLLKYKVLQAFEDSENNFWISVDGRGPICIDKNTGKPTPESMSFNPSFDPSWGKVFLYEDSQKNMWAGSWGGGLFRFDRKSGFFKRIEGLSPARFGPGVRYITEIVEDDSHNLYVGTPESGLFLFDSRSEQFTQYKHDYTNLQSLSSDRIESLFKDNSGTIWVGTLRGLNKYNRYKYKFSYSQNSLTELENHSNFITSIYEDSSETLWIGTLGGGLYRYGKGNEKCVNYNLKSLGRDVENTVLSIFEDRSGQLYIGTANLGLLRLERESAEFTRLTEPLQISDICEDGDGTLWIAASVNGLGSYDRRGNKFKYWQPMASTNNLPDVFDARVIYKDRENNLWVGSDGTGLIKLLPDRRNYLHYRYNPDTTNSLSDDRVLTIFEDAGGFVWIGTRNGLNRYDQKNHEFKRYYEKGPLPDNVICGILADDYGNLWLSTYSGLSKFNTQTGECYNYGVNDGLQDYEFYPGACFKSNSGRLYFGGVNGFNSFYPGNLEGNPAIPNVVITSFSKLGKEVSFNSSGVQLPYSESIFSFEFAALDFVDITRNEYAYKLDGLDKDWNRAGTRRYASYSQVPPGDYVFRVKGSNSDGVWNEEGASLRIVIIPPIWMTWEFRLFLGVIALAVVFGVYKLRTRAIKKKRNSLQKEVNERMIAEGRLLANQARLRSMAAKLTLAEERERRRISLALHDKIGHALLYCKVKLAAFEEENVLDDAEESLKEVIATIDETLCETRSLSVEISPPSLHKVGLEAAAESLLERFGKECGIKTIVSIKGVSPLNEDVAVLIYQSLRELLVNTLKHANASIIKLSIKNDGEHIIVKLQDNGKGFDIEKILDVEDDFKGYGLFSICERMESIGGKCAIISQIGSGTGVTLLAPLRMAS